jgi:dihydrolipoamide dehydrogenase
MQLAHVASAQGVVAAHNACGGQRRMRYDIVPACIYTTPEIASVGLTQAQAQARGISVKAGSFPVAANGRSAIMNCAEGVTKIVTDARTGEVLGAQLMAPRATDMVAEIAAVMRAEGTVEELSDTIHPHPTVSEMIMEAAHDVHGQSCHHPISKP